MDSQQVAILERQHQELVERSDITGRNDLKINDGFFGLGFHDPGRMGLGARIDYSELLVSDLTKVRNEYRITGFSMIFNKYVTNKMTLGLFDQPQPPEFDNRPVDGSY